MDNLLSSILPYINLGVAGVLIGLLIGRILITKKEMDEALAREKKHQETQFENEKAQYEKRISEKDQQILVLQAAVKADSETNSKLSAAWESAMAVITRQNRERNGN